ncbi:translation initiation factor IF-2 [Nemorincola caseinilytica]|uniref:Translation initiation factor IF-2 n=1 Tax=Nemorincola caseinilytica TaxID=2054315 RepID=A0ABP8ND34_9BACT
MSTTTNTPRLLAAAKEFNIGKDTLVEFLVDKGFEVSNNPSTKLTEQMYSALQVEFAQDKKDKQRSENIALPKGSLLEGIKKTKEELDITVKEKKEEPAAKAQEIFKPKPPVEEKPVVVEQPKVAEAPKKAVTEPAPAEPPVAEEPKKAVVAKKADTPEEAEPEAGTEHVAMKAPKLGGPNVLGKIDLDSLNQASRPKKGATAAAGKKKEDTPKEVKESAAEEEVAPVAPATPVATREEEHETPAVAAEEDRSAPAADDDSAQKREHIEMKAPRLEGPKIIGRIELPVSQPGGRPGDNREKRKRKRIPVDKKPDPTARPDAGGAAGAGNRGGQGRPGFGPGGPGGRNDRGPRPGGPGGRDNRGPRPGGPGGRNDRRDPRAPFVSAQQQEIDTKAIQDKIRETQAKLTGSTRSKNLKAKYRRNKRDEMAEKRAAAENAEQSNVIQVTEFISVSELAGLLDVSFAEIIGKCMGLGIMVSINQRLDAEVIELVASEFGYDVEFINLEQEAEEEEDDVDDEEDLLPRAPIVTIMGHVDHGKTSLLDYIRSANVVAGEAGGITQHIGAYQVKTSTGKKITFLDTPGHEAFTAMRARGAKVADVAVIVVAADDAIMPQTREAISHAQAANLPMIFAINKIDKEGANPEKIKEQLAQMNILVEDWGGKYQSQEISAKKGLNIDLLLEKIGLEAEMLELKANPDRLATGSVIEASLDKGRGYQSTILVQSGTLNQGEMAVCGQYYGKIKAMFNERGQRVQTAGPSTPVQVLGLNGAPQAGEKFKIYEDENDAKEVANHRAQIMREQGIRARKHITLDEIGRRLALGNFKELGIIIKGDFDGSVEALSDSLQKLSTEEVAVNVVHKGVGQITESDVLLATASDAIILGFQVRPSSQAAKLAEQENIEIRTYSIIYDAIEEIKSAMEGLLEPKVEKKTVCNIEIREIYKITGVGTIAGCYVLDGKMTRQTKLNLVRDGIVIYTGELASLKRFKDDVKEVNAGYECGLSVKNYNDIRIGDIIEGFEEVEVKRTL